MLNIWEVFKLDVYTFSISDRCVFWADRKMANCIGFLPRKIEVEVSTIYYCNFADCLVIDEEIAKGYISWASCCIDSGILVLHSMLNVVTNTFDVEHNRSTLSFDLTKDVVVEFLLGLGTEENFDWKESLRWNGTRCWYYR